MSAAVRTLVRSAFGRRNASTMVLETAKMSGDDEHPTGFFRDGYCWGSDDDPGRHFVGAVVTKQFLEFSRERGNDLTSRRPGFRGLNPGCRWCLCVERWKEALVASETLGGHVVPRVDLAATALDTLRDVSMDDLERFRYQPGQTAPEQTEEARPVRSAFGSGSGGSGRRGGSPTPRGGSGNEGR